jgi:hypothetical protein
MWLRYMTTATLSLGIRSKRNLMKCNRSTLTTTKMLLNWKEDKEIKKLSDIPNYEMLLMNSIAQGVAGPT